MSVFFHDIFVILYYGCKITKNKQGRKWNIYRIRCKNCEKTGSTDEVENEKPVYKEKASMFSQYSRGSTEVLQRKYYSTFKEVLQSSLKSTANCQAIVYQSYFT